MVRTSVVRQVLVVMLVAVASEAPKVEAQSVVQITATGARNRTGTWAPDGQRVAFGSNRTGTWQLWLMQSDGSGARQLTSDSNAVGGPSWSRDGREVWFESGFRLHRLVVTTGERVPFDVGQPNAFRPVPSPDGERLLFDVSADANHDIWVRDQGTDRSWRLTADSGYDADAKSGAA